MTVKELKEVLTRFPDDLEVFASDWTSLKLVRGIETTALGSVNLRLWLTDKETFEEDRKRADYERKHTEQLLKVKKRRRNTKKF